MRFVCIREKLAKALTTAQRVVSKNFTLPILESVLLETEKGQLKITATNLEVATRCWVQGKVEQEGSITVPASFLSGIVQNLHTEKIEFNTKGTILHIVADDYKATMKGQNAEDFPSVPPVKGEHIIMVDGSQLLLAFSQLQNIVTISEARPEISGVFMKFEDSNAFFVATDSFRLGEKQLSLSKKVKGKDGVRIILPLRAVQEVGRALEQNSEEVTIKIDANQALFVTPNVQITTRLIDGAYPDYAKIIPKDFSNQISFTKEAFMEKLRLISVFSGKTNDIRFHVDTKAQVVSMNASSSEVGEGSTDLNVTVKGDDMDIVFNHRYLMDGLQNINSEKILFELNANTKPSLLRSPEDATYRYIVMPIRE